MAGELPPVVAELVADTSDFIEGYTEAIALLRELKLAAAEAGDSVDALGRRTDVAAAKAAADDAALRELRDATKDVATATVELDGATAAAAEELGHLRTEALEASAALATVRDTTHHLSADVQRDLSEAGEAGGRKLGDNVKRTATKEAEDTGGILSKLIMAGLVAGIPVAGGAVVAAFSLVFAAVGVLVQHNNAKVVAAFSGLASQVVTSVKNMTQGLVPVLVQAAHSLLGVFNELRPQLAAAFTAAAPAIRLFTDGVERLLINLMPGLVAAAHAAVPVFTGLGHVMGAVGSLLGSLTGAFARNGDAVGRALSSLGNLLRDLGNAIGSLISGAVPGLAAGFGGLVATFHAVLSSLQPILPALGAIAGVILPLVADFKLFQLIATPVTKAGDALVNFGQKLASAGGISKSVGTAFMGVGTAIGKLGGVLPFLGAAIGGALSLVQALEPNLQEMQHELLQGGAAAGAAAKEFQKIAFLPGNFKQLVAGLSDVQRAQLEYNLAVKEFGPQSAQAKTAMTALGQASGEAARQQKILSAATNSTAASAADAGVSVNAYKAALAGASAAAKGIATPDQANNIQALGASMSKLGSATATSTEKINAFQTALRLLSEHGLEAANDSISTFYSTLSTLGQQLSSDKGKLLDSSGALNLLTQRGRDAQTALEAARDAMAGYAQNALDANAPQAQIDSHLQSMYRTLEKQLLPAFGHNKKAVDDLLKSMELTPKQIETVYKSNADEQTGKAKALGGQIGQIPTSWFTRLGSNQSFFSSQMGTARQSVQHIPKAWNVMLRAHDAITAVARGAQAVVNGLHGKTITITAALAGVNRLAGEVNALFGGVGHSAGAQLGAGILSGVQAALGIHSPSRVMATEVGKPVTDGIAIGMVSGLRSIRGAVGTIQKAISAAPAVAAATVTGRVTGGALTTGRGRGGGGGTIIINNHVAGTVVSEKQLSQITRTQVLRYNQRNPTNGLQLFGRGTT